MVIGIEMKLGMVGIKMEYLFLCSMGVDRAPTARDVARGIAKEKGLDIRMDSCGFDVLPQLHPDTKNYLSRFDKIFVMEEYMERGILEEYSVDRKKVVCLYVEDGLRRNDPDLIDIFENILRAEIAFHLSDRK